MIILRAAILLITLLVLLFGYELIESIMLKMKKSISAMLFAITLFLLALSSNCCEAFNDSCLDISPFILMSIAVIFLIIGLILLRTIENWKGSKLTAISVKDCVDTLPTGICFYNENGLPVLTNKSMENICFNMLGVYLSDGRVLWDAVNEKNEISDIQGKSGQIVKLSDNKVYSFTKYEADINGKTYYGAYSDELETTTSTDKTKISNLKGAKKKLTLNWKKISKATGYQIQVATDKKFTKNKKSVTISKSGTISTTIKKLKSKKKYYVRVRTYRKVGGKKVYSSWSSVKNVKTK